MILFVLIYVGNTGNTRLVNCDDPILSDLEVAIDAHQGTWERPGRHGQIQIHHIGGMAHSQAGDQYGAIGVYNRTDLSHLNLMIEEVKKATIKKR